MVLMLNREEFSEAWEGIIDSLHNEIISDDAVFVPLVDKGSEEARVSFECRTVLLVMAARKILDSQMPEKVIRDTENRVVRAVYGKLTDSEETLQKSIEYYQQLKELFEQFKDSEKDALIIAYARCLVKAVNSTPEEEMTEVVSALARHLSGADDVFTHLMKSTTVDATSVLFGRYRFLVKRG